MKAIAQATALAASNAMLTCSGCGGTLATGLAPHHVWDHSAVQALHRHRHRACRTRHGRAGDGWCRPEWIHGDQAVDDRQLREPVGDGDYHTIVDTRKGRQS